MIDENLIKKLIALGNENRNLDYKAAFAWDSASKDEKHEITKDILSFSNTADGGILLIGVTDDGVFEGLTLEQSQSFDQTSFNDFV